ncbi:MAG: NAD(P)H-binding protein [Bacteroidia bacterium]|nr:NAD(P)H-binding protein [Bacteroidia bacterium]
MIERVENNDKRDALQSIIFGATGLVGSQLWRIQKKDPRWSGITCIGRSHPIELIQDNKTSSLAVNLFEPDSFKDKLSAEVAFCCLGTTMKKAGSKEAFWRIDVDLPEILAKACAEAGVRRMIAISARGVSSNSMFFYNRAKAAMETALYNSGIPEVVIVRPSLLLGDRQESRLGESIATKMFSALNPLLDLVGISQAGAIHADTLARAMNELAWMQQPNSRYDNEELLKLGNTGQA